MKKVIVYFFMFLLAFVLTGCNSIVDDIENEEVIIKDNEDITEEKLDNNEVDSVEEKQDEDPIVITQEEKFVMIEDKTIFSFWNSLGNTSAFYGNPFSVTYDDDDVLFYCKVDNGYFNNTAELKEIVVKNGDEFEWYPYNIEQNNFFEAVFVKDDNIVGYAVVLCEIFSGLAENTIPVCYFKCLNSTVFPKVNDGYQDVTDEDVKKLISETKNSINKEFKFNYDNCAEISYDFKDSSYNISKPSVYWSRCIVGSVLSCTKVLNNFEELFNSFDYYNLRSGKYTTYLDRFAGIENLEEHKDLFELDFDKRSIIVISETKVDEIDDIKVYVDNNRNLCVRIEGKDTNYDGRLNDMFGEKYYHIREWLFIEVDKIDGLDYTDVYVDIIVKNE